jgi:aromatic ring-cleaving dioxygenase
MSQVTGYHAHVYYDEASFEQASKFCNKVGEKFAVPLGHKHKKPVGPHPVWSCQITLTPEAFAQVIPWLILNRNGLTVFVHTETGDVIKDHTEHTLWMGKMVSLNLDALKREA